MDQSSDNQLRDHRLRNIHRDRSIYLSRDDRPESQQGREIQSISIPADSQLDGPRVIQLTQLPIVLPGLTVKSYNYQETFVTGTQLGMRAPIKRPDNALQALGQADWTTAGALRTSTDQRRTYPIKSGNKNTPSKPFKIPLTPQTHDNKTGTGRVQPAKKRKKKKNNNKNNNNSHADEADGAGKAPDKNLLESQDSTVLTIDASPKTTHEALNLHKRQKLSQRTRSHIKILMEDESAGAAPPVARNTGSYKAQKESSEHAAIQIDSDEESPISQVLSSNSVVTDQRQARDFPMPKNTYIPTRERLLIQGSYNGKSTNSEASALQATLNYPNSDEEEDQGVVRKANALKNISKRSMPSSRDEKEQGQTGIGVATSPYFDDGPSITNIEEINNEDINSDEEPPMIVKSLLLHQPQPITKEIDPYHTKTNTYRYAIIGYGGLAQKRVHAWRLHLNDKGFEIISGIKRTPPAVSIALSDVKVWSWDDTTGVIHIALKRQVPLLVTGLQAFITLHETETNPFIKMLQKTPYLEELRKKLDPGSPRIKQACSDSFALLEQGEGGTSSSRKSNRISKMASLPANSPEIAVKDVFGGSVTETIISSQITDSRTERTSINPLSNDIFQSPKGTDSCSRFLRTRTPIPIPLPRGRDQPSVPDDRNMLVDKEEVSTAQLIADLCQPESTSSRTRQSTKAAAEVAIRDAKSREPLLVYPNTKGQTSVTLYEEDLDRLRPNEFLNDSIIEFYLRYNYDNLREEQQLAAHVFNTFFYQRLTLKKDRDANYQAVRKWTSKGKGVDLFSKKFVVIPINENLHWYLAVIVNLDKIVFGSDVVRAADVSFINASGEDEDENDIETTPLEISAVLESSASPIEIETEDFVSSASTKTGPAKGKDNLPRLVEKPESIAQDRLFDFCDDPIVPNPSGRPSMTERIRADELARNPQLRVQVSAVGEIQAMKNMSITDEIEEFSDGNAQVGKQNTKRKKKPLVGYSKTGKHITEDVPTIVILDSLNNSHPRAYDVIKDYLVREAKDKKNEILSPKQLATCKADLPRQDNYSDCGLFLIQYVDTLLSQPNVVPQLLNRLRFSSKTALQAHKRSFDNMFEIDRIPLRRNEMITQLKELSIPYREQARRDEVMRKHERAVAKREQESMITAQKTEDASINHDSGHEVSSIGPDTPSSSMQLEEGSEQAKEEGVHNFKGDDRATAEHESRHSVDELNFLAGERDTR